MLDDRLDTLIIYRVCITPFVIEIVSDTRCIIGAISSCVILGSVI